MCFLCMYVHVLFENITSYLQSSQSFPKILSNKNIDRHNALIKYERQSNYYFMLFFIFQDSYMLKGFKRLIQNQIQAYAIIFLVTVSSKYSLISFYVPGNILITRNKAVDKEYLLYSLCQRYRHLFQTEKMFKQI